MKNFVLLLLLGAVFFTGYFIGNRKRTALQPVVAKRTSYLGLSAAPVDYGDKRMFQFWVPFGMEGSETGEDYLYLQKEIADSGDELKNIRSAINLLLAEQDSVTHVLPTYRLIPVGGRLREIKLKEGVLKLDFSREFSPGGGSLAMKQVRLAVEEVVRQFAQVKEVEITVEGIADSMEP